MIDTDVLRVPGTPGPRPADHPGVDESLKDFASKIFLQGRCTGLAVTLSEHRDRRAGHHLLHSHCRGDISTRGNDYGNSVDTVRVATTSRMRSIGLVRSEGRANLAEAWFPRWLRTSIPSPPTLPVAPHDHLAWGSPRRRFRNSTEIVEPARTATNAESVNTQIGPPDFRSYLPPSMDRNAPLLYFESSIRI